MCRHDFSEDRNKDRPLSENKTFSGINVTACDIFHPNGMEDIDPLSPLAVHLLVANQEGAKIEIDIIVMPPISFLYVCCMIVLYNCNSLIFIP